MVDHGHDNQSGDHTSRDAAGRDIHQGADATAVLKFLQAYVFEADQRREVGIKDLAHELVLTRGDMGILSDAVRSLRDRNEADARQRLDRQNDLDTHLAEFGEALEAQAIDMGELRRGQRIARHWLAALTLAVLGAAVIIAALILREAGVLAARAALEALIR
jgi:hypothetical protein